MQTIIIRCLALFCLALPLQAAPLETAFFNWDVPQGWTVSRNPSGLWQITAPGQDPLEAVVSVARLTTSPELYLASTATLWKSLGTVEPLEPWLANPHNQAWFLVKHFPAAGEKPMATVKWVRWRGPLLVVTSFRAPQNSLSSWAPKIRSLAGKLRIAKPEFNEAALREEVTQALRDNNESRDSLTDVERIKLAMNVARQDWEPFFGSGSDVITASSQPALYRYYIAYLEARFEASFAIVHGPELGMGADIVESRLRSVGIRRDELRREAQGF